MQLSEQEVKLLIFKKRDEIMALHHISSLSIFINGLSVKFPL
jgi:hypothetical protein